MDLWVWAHDAKCAGELVGHGVEAPPPGRARPAGQQFESPSPRSIHTLFPAMALPHTATGWAGAFFSPGGSARTGGVRGKP